ncbi:hypothetical protein [Pseudoalteromonas lipolytica]|uniref:Uncharacterized protein n=1 Tax=Pseudoalteromonas lipolytica TaxID=570156 RepID=A0ABU8SZ12_9GAMM
MINNHLDQFLISLFVAIFTAFLQPYLPILPEVLGTLLVVSFDICIGYLSFLIEVLEVIRQMIIPYFN